MFFTTISKEKYMEIRDDLKEEFDYFRKRWYDIGTIINNPLTFEDIDECLENSDDEVVVGVPDYEFEEVFIKDYFGSNGVILNCDAKGKISWKVNIPNDIRDMKRYLKIYNTMANIMDMFREYAEFVENIIGLIA